MQWHLGFKEKAKQEAITEPKEKHYDLIGAIRQMRGHLPITLSFRHVKGHQDSGLTTVLSQEAWMNIKMDEVAKRKVSIEEPSKQPYSIPYEGWICYLEGTRITKNLTETLRKHLNRLILLNHWAATHRYSVGAEKTIDWDMAEKAINSMPKAKQRWVSKWVAKFLPYGKNMQRWKLQTQAKCP